MFAIDANLAIIPDRQILSMLNESTRKKGSTFLPTQWLSYLYVNKVERAVRGKEEAAISLHGERRVIYVRTEDSEGT